MAEQKDIRFQTKQLIKQAVQNYVLPVCYRGSRRGKVDPTLVVFADAHHNKRPAAMELLYRKLRKEGCWKIVEHYLDYGTAGASQVAKHSMQFMKLYARAGFVVICDNFLPAASCKKREETKVIQLWHACGSYKKFGYDAKDDIPENYHGANVYRNASLVTVSGEAAVAPFTSAMRLEKGIVQALGVSRTDLYYSEVWRGRCEDRFYQQYPEARGKKIVLWAPTFRGNAGMPVEIPLDVEALQKALGPEYLVLVKLHPHMKRKEICCSIPTEELYPVVDVLIADYSSLIYEYLLFEKQVVLYVPDLAQYRAERGFYMDISEIPGEIVLDEGELPEAVRHAAGLQTAHLSRTRESITGTKSKASMQHFSGDKSSCFDEMPGDSDIINAFPDGSSSHDMVPDHSSDSDSTSDDSSGSASGNLRSTVVKPKGAASCASESIDIDAKNPDTEQDDSYESFMERYMGACDGLATERIAEWMRLQKQGV